MEPPPWAPEALSPPQVLLLHTLITPLLHAIADIAAALRADPSAASPLAGAGAVNAFGDAQLEADVRAEHILRAALAGCPAVAAASSEEDPTERAVHAGGSLAVAFDPLDGSSIVGANWSVGTIVGVWRGGSALGQDPAAQVASVLGVYGPRTTAIIALREAGGDDNTGICFEVGLTTRPASTGPDIQFVKVLRFETAPPTRYFAPANLRAAAEDARYAALVARYMQRRYTLRYSGGLVPDVAHALAKGHGVYLSPVAAGAAAKLRRLYELLPVALAVECAGGRAVEAGGGVGGRVLSRAVRACDERAGVILGSADEVDAAEAFWRDSC